MGISRGAVVQIDGAFSIDHLSALVARMKMLGVGTTTPVELWGQGDQLVLVPAFVEMHLREQGWTLLVGVHGPVGVRAADRAKAKARDSKKATTTRRGPIGWFQRHWSGEAFKEKESS
ncbi:hypothetical protein BI081_gp034 [Mycobacterium phage Tonenili]|uniref:Uncharacterized protein n=1 Tax=Mycobacterium phage Tonenili TaxID=1891703 RepID=A0A1C9EH20_9CAUD|nr:hypothetical protein BI081_gp034 [Mycobacterium phage Tonenili]AON96785.1 hypothetical protein SEA_TONENILI_34 [Mycobacterium phage Tonenili]